MEQLPRRSAARTFALVFVLVAALALAGGAVFYAVSSNKDTGSDTCVQVLKLRDANLKGVDIFKAAVVAGWEDMPPTPRERAVANKFFGDQRAALLAVHCP